MIEFQSDEIIGCSAADINIRLGFLDSPNTFCLHHKVSSALLYAQTTTLFFICLFCLERRDPDLDREPLPHRVTHL